MPKTPRTQTALARIAVGGIFGMAASLAGSQPEWAFSAEAHRPGEGPSAGGAFVLSAQVVAPVSPLGEGQALALATMLASPRSPEGSLCFCGASLFGDGFESGSTGAWSAAVP